MKKLQSPLNLSNPYYLQYKKASFKKKHDLTTQKVSIGTLSTKDLCAIMIQLYLLQCLNVVLARINSNSNSSVVLGLLIASMYSSSKSGSSLVSSSNQAFQALISKSGTVIILKIDNFSGKTLWPALYAFSLVQFANLAIFSTKQSMFCNGPDSFTWPSKSLSPVHFVEFKRDIQHLEQLWYDFSGRLFRVHLTTINQEALLVGQPFDCYVSITSVRIICNWNTDINQEGRIWNCRSETWLFLLGGYYRYAIFRVGIQGWQPNFWFRHLLDILKWWWHNSWWWLRLRKRVCSGYSEKKQMNEYWLNVILRHIDKGIHKSLESDSEGGFSLLQFWTFLSYLVMIQESDTV